MPTILFKRSSTPSAVPTTSDLALGEIGINTYDGKVFIRRDSGTPTIVEVGSLDDIYGAGTAARIRAAVALSLYRLLS